MQSSVPFVKQSLCLQRSTTVGLQRLYCEVCLQNIRIFVRFGDIRFVGIQNIRFSPNFNRVSPSSFEFGRLKCTVGLQSSLPQSLSWSLSKSILEVVDACRSALELHSVSCACRRRPTGIDLVSTSTTAQYPGMCLEYHTFSLHLRMCPENHAFFL